MTLDEQISRGEHAARLLNDELVQEIFSAIREQQIDAWLTSGARDAEGREKIWLFAKMLDRVKNELVTIRDNGRAAQAQVEQQKRDREFARLNDAPQLT